LKNAVFAGIIWATKQLPWVLDGARNRERALTYNLTDVNHITQYVHSDCIILPIATAFDSEELTF